MKGWLVVDADGHAEVTPEASGERLVVVSSAGAARRLCRPNIHTGRLTEAMLDGVFRRARELIGA